MKHCAGKITIAIVFALMRMAAETPAMGAAGMIASNPVHQVPPPATTPARDGAETSRELVVTVGKSIVVDSPVNIQRVAVSNEKIAEALAVTPKEVLINGLAVGETTLIIWQQGGARLFFNLIVQPSTSKLEAVKNEMSRELPDQDITITVENDAVFLRGAAKDMTSADRAVLIASTLGKVVNLLRVQAPPPETQILLKVRFANVDRGASLELGANIMNLGALNTPSSISTGQFSPSRVEIAGGKGALSLGDALNIFLFRKDLNLAATIRALQSKRLLEVLAEPNVMAINGKQASFVSGGEFPFPTLQGGGAGLGSVTISFREFGIRLNFVPVITPRGSIRLQVSPEVSSLDFANGLTFQGFAIPALSTRRIQTEVELDSGQSFVIAGLIDNRLTETIDKIPGLSSIPLLGKLFQTKSTNRSNTELLVTVTPEIVKAIPEGQTGPQLEYPVKFMDHPSKELRTPGMNVTGPLTPGKDQLVPVEQLQGLKQSAQPAPAGPAVQFIPVPVAPPPQQPANPGVAPSPIGSTRSDGASAPAH